MAKCSICGKEAVYCAKYEGRCFCDEHYTNWFEKKVRRTIRNYKFFSKNEHIVIAASGGKDSLAAMYFLSKLKQRVPGWRITALLIDEGIRGYRDVTIKDFIEAAERWGIDHHITSFKEEIGYTLDEIVKIGYEKGLKYKPCTYCGVFRRYLLNKKAREIGGTVLVTAHNLDDVVQTFVMDLLRGDTAKIPRMGPVSGVNVHPKFVKRVKLFYEVYEKEVVVYTLVNNIYPSTFVECPNARFSPRWYVREFLNNMEERQPGTKHSLLRSLLSLINKLKGKERENLTTCKICGEPSSNPVCRACQLKIELGILTPHGGDWGANELPENTGQQIGRGHNSEEGRYIGKGVQACEGDEEGSGFCG